MGPLQIGTTLAGRYRVDRFVFERLGVALYEATDTTCSRGVGLKIIRRERMRSDDLAFDAFKLEAWEPSVVDYGHAGGVPFFVTLEWERRAPKPPLPRPRLHTLLDIDVVLEDG